MPDRMYHDRFGNTFQINTGATGASVFDDVTIGGAATIAETLVVTGAITASGGVTGAVTGAATQVTAADESTDTTCFPLYVTAATGDVAPKTGSNLTFNSSTGDLGATTFTGALVGNVTGNVTGDIQGAALTTEEGSGMAGLTAYTSKCTKVGNWVYTHIFVDIEGIVSQATANDIIGDDDAANAHLGQITVANCGQVIYGSMTCLEAPTGGDNDIDLSASSAATGAEDAAVTALADYAQLLNAGDWTLGLKQALTAVPTADYYLYLSAGTGDTAAAYTAGKFLIELVGYEA